MDAQIVDFESFFNQLIPLTEHDSKIMYSNQGSFFPESSSFVQDTNNNSPLDNSYNSDVVVKQELRKGEYSFYVQVFCFLVHNFCP